MTQLFVIKYIAYVIKFQLNTRRLVEELYLANSPPHEPNHHYHAKCCPHTVIDIVSQNTYAEQKNGSANKFTERCEITVTDGVHGAKKNFVLTQTHRPDTQDLVEYVGDIYSTALINMKRA